MGTIDEFINTVCVSEPATELNEICGQEDAGSGTGTLVQERTITTIATNIIAKTTIGFFIYIILMLKKK